MVFAKYYFYQDKLTFANPVRPVTGKKATLLPFAGINIYQPDLLSVEPVSSTMRRQKHYSNTADTAVNATFLLCARCTQLTKIVLMQYCELLRISSLKVWLLVTLILA